VFETPRTDHGNFDETGGWTPRFAEDYSVFNNTPGNLRGTQGPFADFVPPFSPFASSAGRKRPLSAEGLAAEIATHATHFSPNPNVPLPPVDPARRLPSDSGAQRAHDFPDEKAISYSQNEVLWRAGVSRRTGRRILAKDRSLEPRTSHSSFRETQGRKLKLGEEAVRTTERCIEENGFDGRTLAWAALPAAAGLDIDVSGETVRRHMKKPGFRRRPACRKAYVTPEPAGRCLEYAKTMLEKYPTP